jgi:hypothetical protein
VGNERTQSHGGEPFAVLCEAVDDKLEYLERDTGGGVSNITLIAIGGFGSWIINVVSLVLLRSSSQRHCLDYC